jgi:rod shape-determining protein MreD
MNRFLRYLFFGLTAVVFQTCLVPSLGIVGQRPDLIVIFALTAGVYEGSGRGSLAGFLAGLAADLYHPPTFGAGAMAGTLVGYLGGRARVFFDLDHTLDQMMAYAGGHVTHSALFAFVTSLQGAGPVLHIFFSNGIGGAVYTALLGAALMTVIGLIRGSRPFFDRR